MCSYTMFLLSLSTICVKLTVHHDCTHLVAYSASQETFEFAVVVSGCVALP